MQYEYLTVTFDANTFTAKANELGAEGWQLVTVVVDPDWRSVAIFMRPRTGASHE